MDARADARTNILGENVGDNFAAAAGGVFVAQTDMGMSLAVVNRMTGPEMKMRASSRFAKGSSVLRLSDWSMSKKVRWT